VLGRYVRGLSDEAERRRVETWAAGSPRAQAYLAALVRTWDRIRTQASEAEQGETDAAWSALRARLETPGPKSLPRRSFASLSRLGERRSSWRAAVAAAAVVAIAGGGLVLSHARPTRIAAEHPAPMREVVTGIGERARVQLGDGSMVMLGAASRLRIPATFGERTRELEVEGEAYFEVAHDVEHPFIVHAGGARTVDLGTAFVVRAYPDDRRMQVVVVHGSVALGRDTPGGPAPTVLRPGQMGRLATGALTPTITSVDPSRYTGWMDGRLSFDNAPLSEVISELGRWHRVTMRLADSSLARETFTASFTADSFTEALQTLTTVLALHAERRGTVIVLSRRAH
jgi:ferric-dicitrate binding protein FerR (iron transport regulator)